MNPSIIHMTRILNLFFTDRINPDSGGTLASGRQLSTKSNLVFILWTPDHVYIISNDLFKESIRY
jgi:hypothetical protein